MRRATHRGQKTIAYVTLRHHHHHRIVGTLFCRCAKRGGDIMEASSGPAAGQRKRKWKLVGAIWLLGLGLAAAVAVAVASS